MIATAESSATRELMKHSLLFADHQLLRCHEFEAVAANLVRRSVRRLAIGSAASAWLAYCSVELWIPVLIIVVCAVDLRSKLVSQRRVRGLAPGSTADSSDPA